MTDWREPTSDDQPAGHRRYKRSLSPYERYMDEEGIPVVRGIGVYDVRELTLSPWRRLGGRGCFLYLDGIEDLKGLYVVEVPPGGALKPEKHMYDEFFLVVEGRGSTEVWRDGSQAKRAFEWQPGSLFMAPLNTVHQLVNGTNSPALLLSANNAPVIINIFQSRHFIFENPYDLPGRFDERADFFKPQDEIEADEVRGRAAVASNLFPDVINCELPLDNQRAPGYRRIQPYYDGFMRDEETGGFVAQYPAGRYSKAHYHSSGSVLACLQGAGYTYNWRVELGPRPWEAGNGHLVKIQEYKAGGLVAAAPGGGQWFHQHFAVSHEPFRVMNYWGGPLGRWGLDGERDNSAEVVSPNIYGISEGGRTIHYWEEDPHIRDEFRRRLEEAGGTYSMPNSAFKKPEVQNG